MSTLQRVILLCTFFADISLMPFIAVLSNAKMIGETVKRISPDTLVVLDGVCAVASEEIQFDAWVCDIYWQTCFHYANNCDQGIDVVITASQKGLGTPPGLSILVASQKAVKVCADDMKRQLGLSHSRSSNLGEHLWRLTMLVGRSQYAFSSVLGWY